MTIELSARQMYLRQLAQQHAAGKAQFPQEAEQTGHILQK